MVHAKVMVIDDIFVRIGSSNLSNRSMGLDTECDLAIECAGQDGPSQVIREFRQGLLAEHLGVQPEMFAAAETEHCSLIGAIESLADGERTLRKLDPYVPKHVDKLVPDAAIIDPEKPVAPENLLNYVVGGQQPDAGRRLWRLGLLVSMVLGMAAAWRWTPLSEWLELDRLSVALEWMQNSRFTPLLVLGGFVLGGFLVVPVTLMIVATVIVFGPWTGLLYSIVGAEVSAVLTFAAGHLIGKNAVSRFAGSQLNSISRALSRRGLLTTITLRIVPIAPFSVVNFVAGVSEIRFRDFAIGTLVGLLPGMISIAFLADRVVASLRAPSTSTVLLLAATLTVVVALLLSLRRFFSHRQPLQDEKG